jgi:hypothetical protein
MSEMYTFEIEIAEIGKDTNPRTPWGTVFRKVLVWRAIQELLRDNGPSVLDGTNGWKLVKDSRGGVPKMLVGVPLSVAKAEWEDNVPSNIAKPRGLR